MGTQVSQTLNEPLSRPEVSIQVRDQLDITFSEIFSPLLALVPVHVHTCFLTDIEAGNLHVSVCYIFKERTFSFF